MTHTERKVLAFALDNNDVERIENLLIRANGEAIIRKMRRLRRAHDKRVDRRGTISMKRFWTGANYYGGNF